MAVQPDWEPPQSVGPTRRFKLPGLRQVDSRIVRKRRRLAMAALGGFALLTATAVALPRSHVHRSHVGTLPHPAPAPQAVDPVHGYGSNTEPRLAAARRETTGDTAPRQARPDISRLVGQLIVARFSGQEPSAAFLDRIRAGQIGSVILFADNTSEGVEATRNHVDQLQSAAHEGNNPPLLIMTDQEGGTVRRLPGAPALAPAEMTSDAVALSEGKAAGNLLRSVGVNVDLAPVADVETATGSFLGARSFGSEPAAVAARACAFASGLASAGVAYTLKHFPGLGRAAASTDIARVAIPDTSDALRTDYAAYERCGASDHALVMVSSAVYPRLTGPLPAVMSPALYRRELPAAVGRSGSLTISDDLEAPAIATQRSPALQAIDAGLDLAMYATSEAGSAAAYSQLIADARSGALSLVRLRGAVDRIEALKRTVAQ